ncbi:hypothetical protein [Paraburkholderia sp.]|uniref:hypothetical protein n=1 Tax=Paraburkholderia sp. TaxID=1926495 RepID=UPI00239D769C|nr:hypothetical protein [Paraburkholderia sp.]MDE1181833.1 hypothetical protein [Paraburkholderia sp.]
MDTLASRIAEDLFWDKWIAANSSAGAGCISDTKDGCISVVKEGCISIARNYPVVKAGCIS